MPIIRSVNELGPSAAHPAVLPVVLVEIAVLDVLLNSTPPALFVELGNIQNSFDQRRFVISDNRQALANWMREGLIADYKKCK